ncbi:TMV resistance protein N-like [Neltuma alba]|uniref:TMV resistance protein N-like n=1 Tax=Neltuma alba TaxID=207710 RepID=UPI0010A36294|nr:TMV resistance protein N-like [Prosopis alba]
MALNDQEVGYSSSYCRSNRRHKYDVFLSFRGEDTRKNFADHLYAALCHNGLITFRDEEELGRGEIIKPSLLQAIEESLSAIIVLSENYATSTWCLDELLKILHCKKELGLHIFPIFYGIDPSDVRHQKGSFAKAFEKLEQKFAHDKVKVQRWRDALREVADLAGWSSENWYETKLIEIVTENVRSRIVDHPQFDSNDEGVDDGLVGIDEKIADFDSFLANKSEEVQFLGIWGMGGLGKTTLARIVYERIHRNYEVHLFLHNVREESVKDGGLISLQQKLLSRLKKSIRMEVCDCYDGRKLIRRMLCSKKVLLVLDDVSDISQLENLAGKEGWFGKGSRIIITTRDQHVLLLHGVVSQYEMNFLSHDESLQLFIQIAFKGDQPNEDYLELSRRAINSAQNLPLAIKVLGSFLCGRSIPEWENALKKIPLDGLFDILKVSFDGLRDNEKNIFLDIACFFNGLRKDDVIQILENSGLHPIIGIRTLIQKSLVTEAKGRLRVHDRLQEMGKEIVFRESTNDAGNRSRIWSLEDASLVLRNMRGTEAIRGIVVQFDKPDVIYLEPKAFSNMSNLKLLIISHSSHDQLNLLHGLNCLPNSLKVIDWKEYPLDSLPGQTQFDELVDLKMQHSKLKELWRGDQFPQSLKFIDLSHSTNLMRTSNFDRTPNLQRLILKGCTKLVEVHCSFGQHKNLVIVNFKGCKSIKNLPTKLEMNCLETFILSGCSKVKRLPEFGKGMTCLSKLNLKGTAISKLPQSLVNLTGLVILNLKYCKSLVCLPSDFKKLKAIKKINIRGCSKLSRLPENLNENEALEELDVGGTALKEVPSSLNNLKVLSLSACNSSAQSSSWNHYSLLKRAFRLQRPSSSTKFLWSPSFSNLSSLVELHLNGCNLDDESLSSEIGNLSSLTALGLAGNNFVEIPLRFISKLRKLEFIYLKDCPRLRSLPQLPANLSVIHAGDCPLLKNYVCSQQLWEFTEEFEYQTSRRYEFSSVDGYKVYTFSDMTSAFVRRNESQVDDFFLQPTRILTIPGSEVPSWFHNQSYFCAKDLSFEDTPTNVSFIVNKPDSCCSSEWWGIAVCLVLENDSEHANYDDFAVLGWTYRVSEVQCGWRVLCKEDVERWRNTSSDEGCSVSTTDDKFIDESR